MEKSLLDPQTALASEQFAHIIDLLKAENAFLRHRVVQLEEASKDHEARLRAATEGVTQFKVWSGLAAGGSSIMAIIAFIRAFTGG